MTQCFVYHHFPKLSLVHAHSIIGHSRHCSIIDPLVGVESERIAHFASRSVINSTVAASIFFMCVNCSLSAYQKKEPHHLRWRGALKKVNDATIHTAKAVQSGAYSCTVYAVELREMLRDVWSNLEGNRKVHATPPTGRAVLPFFSPPHWAHMMREVKIENKPQIAGIERQLFFFFCFVWVQRMLLWWITEEFMYFGLKVLPAREV